MIQSQFSSMTFVEYKRLHAEGKILVGISHSNAQKVVDFLPRRYQYATYFWSSIWLLSIPGFVCVSLFYRWWVGLLLLFFVTRTLFRAINKSISQFVIEHAEDDEHFFTFLVERNLLVFKPTGKTE